MANPKKGTSQARNEFIWGWAFILPTMLGLIILNIYPIFKTIYESFFKTGDFGKGNIFIGFEQEDVQGLKTEKLFLKEELVLPKDTKLNDVLDLSFNMRGKVEKITKK